MSMTVSFANQLAGALFSHTPLSVGSSLSVALFTTALDIYGGGVQVNGGGGYVPVSCDAPDWTVTQNASGMTEVRNAVALVFPVPTASWGTVVSAGLYDGPTLLCAVDVVPSITIEEGDNPPAFAIGALKFNFE